MQCILKKYLWKYLETSQIISRTHCLYTESINILSCIVDYCLFRTYTSSLYMKNLGLWLVLFSTFIFKGKKTKKRELIQVSLCFISTAISNNIFIKIILWHVQSPYTYIDLFKGKYRRILSIARIKWNISA